MMNLESLKSRRENAVAKGVGTRGIYAKSAQNAELWDVEGKRYIDFAAGIAVNNTGHRHPKVMEAVASQATAFTHTCFHVAPYESYIALAERLNEITPGDFKKKTMLVTIAKRLNFDYILSYDLSCKISPSCSCFSRERGFDF